MLSTEDRLDVHDLYARYAHSFDFGIADEWANVFTPDGTFDIDGEKQLRGTEELSAFARGMYKAPGMRHFVSNLLVTATPEGAAGRAYVQVMRTARDGSLRMLNMGEYDDRLVRVAGSWLFSARRFTSWLPPALADAPLASPRDSPA